MDQVDEMDKVDRPAVQVAHLVHLVHCCFYSGNNSPPVIFRVYACRQGKSSGPGVGI